MAQRTLISLGEFNVPLGRSRRGKRWAGNKLEKRRPTTAVCYKGDLRRRKALTITETELKLMAALAIIGLRSQPKIG